MNDPAAADELEKIVWKLRAWEGLFLVKVFAMLALGLPLSLLGPAILASAFWLVAWRLGWGYPWMWFFVAAAAVTVPLLYRLEIRTRGAYLSRAVQASGADVPTGAALAPSP